MLQSFGKEDAPPSTKPKKMGPKHTIKIVKSVCFQKNKLRNYTELDKIYNTLVRQDIIV